MYRLYNSRRGSFDLFCLFEITSSPSLSAFKMFRLSPLTLALSLPSIVAAAMSGPGNIFPHLNGVSTGCLNDAMAWVVDGSCGTFTAVEITGLSTVVQFTSLDGPCCHREDGDGTLLCVGDNWAIQNFIVGFSSPFVESFIVDGWDGCGEGVVGKS